MDHAGETARRLELAQRMAQLLADRFGAVASLVAGSVALGLSDSASDIDLILYYDELPDEAELLSVRESVGGSPQQLLIGAVADEGLVESYWLGGIRIDFAHSTLRRLRTDLAEVLEQCNPDTPVQKIASGIQHGLPLHGAALVEDLRAQVSAYPEPLRLAMAERHLRFHPRWVLRRMGTERGDLFLVREKLVEAARAVLLTLCGVNRHYHWGEFKHLSWVCGRLTAAPKDLERRLLGLFALDPAGALEELDALILETMSVVARELPQFDIEARRAKYLREYGG